MDASFELRAVTVDDPLAEPLLRELADEYRTRYPEHGDQARTELTRYPADEFAPPYGTLLLLLEHGEPVAGGAFRRYRADQPQVAELKRIWTGSAHRRRGLARHIVNSLEQEAAARGYTAIHLTTGPRQPEARALYLAAGYTPLFDLDADPETVGSLPFTKRLDQPGGGA
ncbi:GNAT family N-acetyltransferase [Streptacidiphilus sp. MAP12-20]|uniref:GNAT family N-acetyltransferase n=1 Tax=Streptacidiphilus sp. MAP12-20 TaxID=3156299 RepID=UPI003513252B